VINAPETLETARLRLRKPVPKDAEVIFRQYAQDTEVTKFLTWQPHGTIETTREFVRRCLDDWKQGKSFHWIITGKSDNQLMGMISARVDSHKINLGYGLARGYWGKGYMPEAIQGLIEWALKQPEIYRVWAVCDVDNSASARVLEKVGMRREGLLHRWSVHPNVSAEPRDSFCYSITK
jgi:ribosomal-protein-alanine N-acetyltransferase